MFPRTRNSLRSTQRLATARSHRVPTCPATRLPGNRQRAREKCLSSHDKSPFHAGALRHGFRGFLLANISATLQPPYTARGEPEKPLIPAFPSFVFTAFIRLFSVVSLLPPLLSSPTPSRLCSLFFPFVSPLLGGIGDHLFLLLKKFPEFKKLPCVGLIVRPACRFIL